MSVEAWIVPPGHAPPTPERFKPVLGPDCLNKPGRGHDRERMGLWTSGWLGPERISGWAEWCGGEQFAGPDYQVFLLHPDPAARLWEIDTHADLCRLVDRYGLEGPIFRTLGRHSMFPEMDFGRFAADGYIGVHLTDEGQWRTRGTNPNWPAEPSLYGWDCESTLWCQWAFTAVEDLGVLTWQDTAAAEP